MFRLKSKLPHTFVTESVASNEHASTLHPDQERCCIDILRATPNLKRQYITRIIKPHYYYYYYCSMHTPPFTSIGDTIRQTYHKYKLDGVVRLFPFFLLTAITIIIADRSIDSFQHPKRSPFPTHVLRGDPSHIIFLHLLHKCIQV